MTDILVDIRNELKILNSNMEILVKEHLKHFEEWREKNVYG